MNSLRSRMIVGFALVAVIPLAIVMLLLGKRIQDTVRAQASERLAGALGVLDAQLGSDARRLSERLELLGRDPQLKRGVLAGVSGAAELRETLARQRFLLGLDFLAVTDTAGRVLADAAMAASARVGSGREPVAIGVWEPVRVAGVRVTGLPAEAALALDAIAEIRYGGNRVGLVRGGVLLDSMLLARLRQTSGVELVLCDASGRSVASTFPEAPAPATPGDRTERVTLDGRSFLARGAPIGIGPGPHARIVGFFPTTAADETIAALRVTALLLGLLGVALAIVLGMLWSLQVSRPVERLARFSERMARGDWDEPLALESVRELRILVAALERMRADLGGYRERLRTTERQAAYGEMARQVAHEIKNPLTPIAVSVADLKRSFDQGRPDFPEILDQAVRTIGEELQRLKQLLQEFSELGRFPSPQPAPCDVAGLLADLGTLYAHEIATGRLVVEPPRASLTLDADRGQLRQALINLVQNGLDAVAEDGHVRLSARSVADTLEIVVADDGPGLSPAQRERLFVPGFTTKTHGSGLGLAIVERIVADHQGTIAVESEPDCGATFRIRLPIARGA